MEVYLAGGLLEILVNFGKVLVWKIIFSRDFKQTLCL